MTRIFDAPRALVYEALTRPDLVKRWLGAVGGWSMAVCEIDLRVGGTYRYVWQGPDGERMGMRGTYREIVPAERIVSTETFDEKWYEGDAVGTVTLVERAGKTTLTTTVRYSSRAVRDSVLESPMKEGVAAGYDHLEQVLESMTSTKR